MFRHVVMFSWADGVDDAQIAAIGAALDELPGQVDVLRDYRHGPDAGVSEGNADYVVVADLDNVEDYVTYRDHPAHVEVIERHIKGHVAERTAVQYEFEG